MNKGKEKDRETFKLSFYFRGLRLFTSEGMFSCSPVKALEEFEEFFWQSVNSRVRHMYMYSVGMLSCDCSEQETQRIAKARGLGKHAYSYWQVRWKDWLVQSRSVKGIEKQFLFGARKRLFLAMHRLHFLSEASWKIIIFVFIHLFYFEFI